MAYRWRHRNSSLFKQEPGSQPAWIRGLRRAWLKNPRTLALLRLTPVCEEQSGRTVAYRRADGTMLSPEDAGPSALPVLVSTPKKVTKEYAQEIRVAWPEAQVVRIEQYTDIVHWFELCAHCSAPAVIGIVSHSLTRAFGRAWQPVVREKRIVRRTWKSCSKERPDHPLIFTRPRLWLPTAWMRTPTCMRLRTIAATWPRCIRRGP